MVTRKILKVKDLLIQISNATFLSLFYYKSIQNFVCGLSVYIYYPLCLEVRSLSINYYSVAVPTSHNQFNQISKGLQLCSLLDDFPGESEFLPVQFP